LAPFRDDGRHQKLRYYFGYFVSPCYQVTGMRCGRASQIVEVLRGFGVQLQRPRERIENLRGPAAAVRDDAAC
jgi:hypothetical protein